MWTSTTRSTDYHDSLPTEQRHRQRYCFQCRCRSSSSLSLHHHSEITHKHHPPIRRLILLRLVPILFLITLVMLVRLGNTHMYHQLSSHISLVSTVHKTTSTRTIPTELPLTTAPNLSHSESDFNEITTTTNTTTGSISTTNTTIAKPSPPAYTKHNNDYFTNMMMMMNHSTPNQTSSSSSLTLPPDYVINNIPKGMVWLVSFPNSGTTYTISIVQSMTNTSTATNYGGNERDTKNNSLPVFYDSSNHRNNDNNTNDDTSSDEEENLHVKGGPYYRSPKQLLWVPYRDAHIITKTHCEQRINGTLAKFIASCATGSRYDNYQSVPTTYSNDRHLFPPRLSGIVYLVRNPFMNILGRMNYQRNQWLRSSDPINHQRASFFPKHNRTGFYWWCQYKDQKHSVAHSQLLEYQNGTFFQQYLQPVPCYMEFYLYFRWHSMANEMISHFRQNNNNSNHDKQTTDITTSPNTMMIYYEDYEHSDSRTTIVEPLLYDMLHFTPDQIVNSTIPHFIIERMNETDEMIDPTNTGDDRHHPPQQSTMSTTTDQDRNHIVHYMYTPEQRSAIKRLAQVMTTPSTWKVLQHYFVDID